MSAIEIFQQLVFQNPCLALPSSFSHCRRQIVKMWPLSKLTLADELERPEYRSRLNCSIVFSASNHYDYFRLASNRDVRFHPWKIMLLASPDYSDLPARGTQLQDCQHRIGL